MSLVIGLQSGTSRGTTVNSGGGDAKGSWTVIGNTGAGGPWNRFDAAFGRVSTNNNIFLIDIDVGGVIVAENILWGGKATSAAQYSPQFRVERTFPANQDVRMRAQNSGTGRSFDAHGTLTSDHNYTPGSTSDNYGANLGTSDGTIIDAGATPHTEVKGELTTVAGLTNPANKIIFTVNNLQNGTIVTTDYQFRVYTGATGATASGHGWNGLTGASVDYMEPSIVEFDVDPTVFAAGTRVWLGVQCSNGSNPNNQIQAVLHTYQTAASGGGGQPERQVISIP